MGAVQIALARSKAGARRQSARDNQSAASAVLVDDALPIGRRRRATNSCQVYGEAACGGEDYTAAQVRDLLWPEFFTERGIERHVGRRRKAVRLLRSTLRRRSAHADREFNNRMDRGHRSAR